MGARSPAASFSIDARGCEDAREWSTGNRWLYVRQRSRHKDNKQAALYWYKRAYRRGEGTAAHNIGTVWRDDGNFPRALYWFERALQLNGGDDGEANFEIAKLYLGKGQDPSKGALFLRKVCRDRKST